MKKKIVSYLIENNILVQPEIVKKLDDTYLLKKITELVKNKTPTKEILSAIYNYNERNQKNQENQEKHSDEKDQTDSTAQVKILLDYDKEPLKKDVSHFVKYYKYDLKIFQV